MPLDTLTIITSLSMFGYLYAIWAIYSNQSRCIVIALSMGVALIAHATQIIFDFAGLMNHVSITNLVALVSLCMAIIGSIRYFLRGDKVSYYLIALISVICIWLPILTPAQTTITNNWSLKAHILLSTAAYIALGFAALYACFLLLQDHRLKKGTSGFNLSLSLCDIENTMMSFTRFGEALLTLSLVTGLIFIENIWSEHFENKLFFSAVAWLIIGTLLTLHQIRGFRGRPAAYLLISGFVSLIIAYFGSSFILQYILQQ